MREEDELAWKLLEVRIELEGVCFLVAAEFRVVQLDFLREGERIAQGAPGRICAWLDEAVDFAVAREIGRASCRERV